MNYWIPSARFVVLAVTLAAVGCGGGAKTARVSGKITYKSQPISYG